MGTAGYIDPEFIRTRRPSVESDVYRFCVVLLDIVTGRLQEMEHPGKVIPLLKWIWDLYNRNALVEAVDKRLLTKARQLLDGGSASGSCSACWWSGCGVRTRSLACDRQLCKP